MPVTRRHVLWMLTGATGAIALNACSPKTLQQADTTDAISLGNKLSLPFRPTASPIPLAYDALSPADQMTAYASYAVSDDLVLPEGYEYEVLASWGDSLGDSRIGYNNDYLGFTPDPSNADRAYLGVNFEYISSATWMATYGEVIGKMAGKTVGKTLPFDEVRQALSKPGKGVKGVIDAFALKDGDPLKEKIMLLCREAMIDQGFGVMALKRDDRGRWQRDPEGLGKTVDRRITGISGLDDGRYAKITGPAIAVFTKTSGEGYIDGMGDKAIGTFANCSGGTTPWGTFLSAEENFQRHVPEPVKHDGTSEPPSTMPFDLSDDDIGGFGNVFGLAGNKYGWIVEIDPTNPKDHGTKHTWLGRYRHEAVGVRVVAGEPIAFYSGCDRRGGHVYKFVSKGTVSDPTDKANSQLLGEGMLYVAKFKADGTGQWLALNPAAAINPDRPSQVIGNTVILHDVAGYQTLTEDAAVEAFATSYQTLADLYTGTPEQQQGAIMIDAHYAANAIGGTYTARPEDTDIAPDGSLYITFTSGSPDEMGGPDKAVFASPIGEEAHEAGWVMRLIEADNRPSADRFTWKMAATGGEPSQGGAGMANPDNLLIDQGGNIWMVTDMSTDKHNRELPSRRDETGQPLPSNKMIGIFGNNSLWYMPMTGEQAGVPLLFAIGPMECETTGPCFDATEETLFLAVQHPGEANGTRQAGKSEERTFILTATDGTEFKQTRTVPIGSNWPSQTGNVGGVAPRPSVVAIYRTAGGAIIG